MYTLDRLLLCFHHSQQELQKTAAEQMDLVGRLSGSTVDQSLKAYYREFRKVVEMSDVVLEVLDARDPLGCRCYQVEQAVMAAGSDKKLILVLNKIGKFVEGAMFVSRLQSINHVCTLYAYSAYPDLVPRRIVEAWLKHFRNEFPTVAFKASTQTQKQHLVSVVPCVHVDAHILYYYTTPPQEH